MEMTHERLLHSVTIPVTKLLEMDNCRSPNALADALGDSYLCEHNPLYASVRAAAIGLGYHFSALDAPIWRDYLVLGLTTLQRIVASMVIPYFDTKNTLRRLLESNPKCAFSPGFLLDSLKRNHTFHEAAHCVAHAACEGMKSDLRAVLPGERERFVVQAILEESFANTVERLGGIAKCKPIADEVFYPLNSYMAAREKITEILNNASQAEGAERLFALLFLAHVEANFSGGDPAEATYERIAMAANCGTDSAIVRDVVNVGWYELNTQFRKYTTPMYFDLLGYKNEYLAVASAPWLTSRENVEFVQRLIRALFETTVATARQPMEACIAN